MARKVVNRKALREAAEAAEKLEKSDGGAGEAAPKKKAAKRKSKAKTPEVERKVLFWGVFNQNMKMVVKYAFNQKKQAEQKAQELSASGKSPHFVKRHTENVVEEA
jgi:hypothetical protein